MKRGVMYPRSKRQGMIAMIVLAAVVVAGNAWAQARKTTVGAGVDTSGAGQGNVSISYIIKGVGNNDLCAVGAVTYTADCACRNPGGNCPSDAKKQAQDFPVENGEVVSPRNGQIKGTVTLEAPTDADCAVVLGSCPSPQKPILAKVLVGTITLDVFDQGSFTDNGDGTCTANTGATPIRSATITPSPTSITFDAGCAALFP